MFGKRALQTRHDEVLRDYHNRTAELKQAYKRIEQLTAQVGTETQARVEETQARGMLLDFLQEVMIFVQDAPILVRNGKPWQVKRDSLVQRAKAQNWYREPQHEEQEAEQGTE